MSILWHQVAWNNSRHRIGSQYSNAPQTPAQRSVPLLELHLTLTVMAVCKVALCAAASLTFVHTPHSQLAGERPRGTFASIQSITRPVKHMYTTNSVVYCMALLWLLSTSLIS